MLDGELGLLAKLLPSRGIFLQVLDDLYDLRECSFFEEEAIYFVLEDFVDCAFIEGEEWDAVGEGFDEGDR